MRPIALTKDIIKTLIPDGLLVHRLPRQANNSILLTFDDGPDDIFTPLVLERLAQHNARAIFFVIGKKVEAYPDTFKMILDNGHIIGNHTYNHPFRIITSITEYKNELLECSKVIKNRTGNTPLLARPPLGLSFTSLVPSGYLKMKTVLWSAEGGEWGIHKTDNASTISRRLIKHLQPRDIVLLHDNNAKVPEILDTILPHIKNEGIDLYSGVSSILP
jgi:peptidoglycan/xylan/chitin deacetylase (PgdA/CDA1 family)